MLVESSAAAKSAQLLVDSTIIEDRLSKIIGQRARERGFNGTYLEDIFQFFSNANRSQDELEQISDQIAVLKEGGKPSLNSLVHIGTMIGAVRRDLQSLLEPPPAGKVRTDSLVHRFRLAMSNALRSSYADIQQQRISLVKSLVYSNPGRYVQQIANHFSSSYPHLFGQSAYGIIRHLLDEMESQEIIITLGRGKGPVRTAYPHPSAVANHEDYYGRFWAIPGEVSKDLTDVLVPHKAFKNVYLINHGGNTVVALTPWQNSLATGAKGRLAGKLYPIESLESHFGFEYQYDVLGGATDLVNVSDRKLIEVSA